MKTIHKHRLDVSNEVQEVKIPEDGKCLRVDYILQDRCIFIWVEVEADTLIETPKETRQFKVFHTGDGIPKNALYVGSTVNHLKPEAYHVYELVD